MDESKIKIDIIEKPKSKPFKASSLASKTISIYDLSKQDLLAWIEEHNEKKFRVQQFFDHVYVQRQPTETLKTWPTKLLKDFLKDYSYGLNQNAHQISKDGTQKWLYTLNDGNAIESVLMPYEKRATVCISSQAGCAMGCTFCATGQAGFFRQLTSGEIVEQVARAFSSTDKRISNIVFMGMGEPLANTKNVKRACERLINDFGFSARNITISTVGIIPGINEMATWDIPITLAISLHSPFDDLRSELAPINKRYRLIDVLKAAQDYSHVRSRRVSFEYAAIAGSNTTTQCAHECGRLLGNFRGAGGAHLNIIPLNITSGFSGHGASSKDITRFADIVRSYGPTVTIRRNRGNDIDAACGQLRERHDNTN